MPQIFTNQIITLDGQGLIAQATAANPISWVDALSKATVPTDPADPTLYSGLSGTVDGAAVSGLNARTARIVVAFGNTTGSTAQDVKAIAVRAKLASQSDSEAVIFAYCTDASSTITFPPSTAPQQVTRFAFNIAIQPAESFATVTAGDATLADLQSYVSAHLPGQANVGEPQNIYGAKTFQSPVVANNGLTTSYLHAYGIDEGICIQLEGEYGESGYITYGGEYSKGIEFYSQNVNPDIDHVSARDCFTFKDYDENYEDDYTILRISRPSDVQNGPQYYTYTNWPFIVDSELKIIELGRADSGDPDVLCNQINFIPYAPQGSPMNCTLGDSDNPWKEIYGKKIIAGNSINNQIVLNNGEIAWNSDNTYIEYDEEDFFIRVQNSNYINFSTLDNDITLCKKTNLQGALWVNGAITSSVGIIPMQLQGHDSFPRGTTAVLKWTTSPGVDVDRGYFLKKSTEVGKWKVYNVHQQMVYDGVSVSFSCMDGTTDGLLDSSNYEQTDTLCILSTIKSPSTGPFLAMRM